MEFWRGIRTPDASSLDGENLENWAMLQRSFRPRIEMLLQRKKKRNLLINNCEKKNVNLTSHSRNELQNFILHIFESLSFHLFISICSLYPIKKINPTSISF